MTTMLTPPEHITALKEALNNADPAVRFNAALDLVNHGDVTGIPFLIEAFSHESGAVRLFHASKALVNLGQPAVPALSAALQSVHPQVRIDAACTLYQIVPTQFSRLLPLLTEALQSAEPKVVSDALHFLSVVNAQERKAAVPALLQALRSTTPAADPESWVTDVRAPVAILLAQSGASIELIVPALVEALCGAITAVRWGAACALAELGPAARSALPTLAQVIGDETESATVRVEAAYALAVIGDPRQDTLPVLLKATQSEDWWVRAFAARILGELAATPVARPPSDFFDPITRALMGMRPLPHLPDPPPALGTALVHLLTDLDYNVRRNATAALANLAAKATAALPALLAALRQPAIAPLAAEALAQIGCAAVPALKETLTIDDVTVVRYAAYALRLIQETDAQAKLAVQPSPVAPFQPLTHHFYCQVQVTLEPVKSAAFEALYQATLARGLGSAVDYTLAYPKHEFLQYLVEQKGLFLHGSGKVDIDLLRPFRYGVDAADHGNVSGVYADKDPIRPIYFAVVNGARCFGQSNGYFNLLADGQHSSKGDLPCNERFYKLAIGVNGLRRPFWRPGMLYILPPDTFTYQEEWTSRAPVPPLMRLAVTPDDLPLRDQVWGSDWRQLETSWVDARQPFPFLKDVQRHPILPSGRPLWC